MKPRSFAPAPLAFLSCITLAASAHAQTTRTWVGTTADMTIAENWSPGGVPSATAGDSMRFNGSATANAIHFNGGTFSANDGLVSISVEGGQINPLVINNTGGAEAVFRMRANGSITIQPGAAAVTLGNASNTFFLNLSNTANSANTFTNQSSNTATIGDRVSINATGGNNGQLVIDGSGDWLIAGTTTTNGISRGLIKNGTGTLTLAGATNHTSTTTVNAGTLALANANALRNSTLNTGATGPQQITFTVPETTTYNLGGLAGTNPLTPGANSLNVGSNNASTTFAGNLVGTGGVTKLGTGALTLNGALTNFTGTLTVQNGTLNVPATSTLGGNLALTGGNLNFGGSVAGSASLSGGTLLVNPTSPAPISITGDLSLSNTVNISLTTSPPNANPIPVLTYSGTLTGGSANLALVGGTTNFRNPTFNDATTGIITLALDTPLNLVWNGGFDWDINLSENWTGGDGKFFQLDHVTFNEDQAGTITITQPVLPSSVTINGGEEYTFNTTGSGAITGSTKLTKNGTGILNLGGAHSFTGGIALNGGILSITNNQALGANNSAITIAAGATLDLNGAQSANRDYSATIAGEGIDGTGAIVNHFTNRNHGFGSISLAANATVGGTARWDLRPITAGTGSLNLNGFTLTKTGNNLIALVDSVITGDGSISIDEGIISFTRNTVAGAGTIHVNPAAQLLLENNSAGSFTKNISVTDGSVRAIGNAVTINSTVTLTDNASFQTVVNLTVNGNISGAGTLTKTETGALILLGNASPAGGTTISSGSLQIGNGGTTGSITGEIANFGNLTINRSDDTSLTNDIFGTGSFTKAGAGTLELIEPIESSGAVAVQAGTLRLTANNLLNPVSTATLSGGLLDLNGHHQEVRSLAGAAVAGNSAATRSILTTRPADGDNVTFSGTLEGNLRFAVVGDKPDPSFIAPRQRLAGTANTHTGGTTVDGATLMVRLDGSLGAIPADFEPDHIILRNQGTLLNEADANVLSIHANRGVRLESGGGAFVGGFNNTVTIHGVISGNATSTLSILPNNGWVVFTGNNTYEGETILPPPVGGTARLRIGNGGTSGTLGSGNTVNNGILEFNRSDNSSYAGNISGSGTLNKRGEGTLTLTGNTSHTGTTTVFAGTLVTRGSAVSATSVLSGATLSAAQGIGSLAASSLTIGAGATLHLEIDSASSSSDLVTTSGNITLEGTSTLSLADVASSPQTLAVGTKLTVADYSGHTLTGTFNGIPDGASVTAGANTFTIRYADTNNGQTEGSFITLTATGAAPTSPYDTWATANNLTQGPDGDDDNDGTPNLLEFIFGTNPTTPGPSPLTSSVNGSSMTLTFPRSDEAESAGITLVVQHGPNLSQWTDIPIGATSSTNVAITENGSLPDTVTVTIPTSGNPKHFARLKATLAGN